MTSSVPANPIESFLTAWRVRYDFVPRFPIESIVDIDGQQVRKRENIANPATVEEYYQQLKNGAEGFPPIVLRDLGTPDGKAAMVDGNTRRAAYLRDHRIDMPAYVLTGVSMDHARQMAGGLNQLGGVRLTADEAMATALDMMASETAYTDAQIARNVGRAASQVRQWRDAQTAFIHAKKLGVTEIFERVPKGQHRVLAKIVQDEPFKAAVNLAGTRKVPHADLKKLVSEVTTAPSEEDALAAVSAIEAELPLSGPDGSTVIRNDKARRMRMLLPQIANLATPDELYEAERAVEDRASWLVVLDRAEKMLAYYSEMRGDLA